MKLHLPLLLRSSLLACIAALSSAQAFTENGYLGNTMFVGDSITHGYNAMSYRWDIHKIFADNGINYTEVGVVNGNFNLNTRADDSDLNINRVYGETVWLNKHSARSAERATEIAGLSSNGNRLK